MSNTRTASRPSPGLILTVMVAGAFIAFLNQTLMNVALPKIMIDLNISATTAEWMSTIFMLVNGVLIPVTAFLMERFTTRQLFITAMSLFAIGTLVCGVGPNLPVILTGRIIQAAGAGILFPLMTNVILTLFEVGKRGAAMGIIGLAMNFAPAMGPTLSGWIIEHHSWRILFFIIFPVAVLDIIAAFLFLKNVTETRKTTLDVWSVILSTFGFGGVLYGFTAAGEKGWDSIQALSTLAVGLIAIILFVRRQLTSKNPMLEFRIFRYPMFTLTTIILTIVTMAMFAGMILIPLYMQNIRGFTSLQSGLLLLPGGILMGIMSPITGKLFDKIGAKWLAVVGLAITAATTYPLSRLSLETTFTYMMVVYTARMFGMSMLMMPIMTAGLNQLPGRYNPHGTALSNTIRTMASAVGTALFVTVMTNRGAAHVKDIITGQHILPTDKAHMALAASQGTIMGINDAFLLATVIAVIALIPSFFIRKTTPMEDIITERSQPAHPKGKAVNHVALDE